MLIILEGPDGSGKTHLARDLEELILRARPSDTVEVRHSGPPGDVHPLDAYERSISWYRPGEGNHLILDRWHWGEYVYPAVKKRDTKLNYVQEWHIENYLLRLGAIVVQTTQYADQYRRVYHERNEPHEQAILPAVEHYYRHIRQRTYLPVVDWNWMSPMWGDMHRVIQLADETEALYRELNQFVTYVGPRRADFLLLGDDRAIRRQGDDLAKPVLIGDAPNLDPAFMPFASTSGHFLIGAIFNSPDVQRNFNVGIANACDVDDPYRLWLALGQPQVVALGRNAKKRISELAKIGFWPRGFVPHPQYVRRFHHGDQDAYGQNIRMAARHGGDYSKWHAQLRDERVRMSTARSSKPSDDAVSVVGHATA